MPPATTRAERHTPQTLHLAADSVSGLKALLAGLPAPQPRAAPDVVDEPRTSGTVPSGCGRVVGCALHHHVEQHHRRDARIVYEILREHRRDLARILDLLLQVRRPDDS